MLADARSLADGERIETDVCVVGAGPAGLTLALTLARAGVEVCVLESGGPTDEPLAGEVEGEPYPPLATTRRRGIGGTAALWNSQLAHDRWGARLLPLEAGDFEERPDVPGSGWPFPRSTLDPFYARAAARCGLGAFTPDPADWVTSRTSVPALGDTVETAIFRFAPASVFREDARAELERSPAICYLGARALALDHRDGRAVALRAASAPGRELTVLARAYALALGGIENARLLLLSGLASEEGPVGRFFMDHPTLRARLVLDASVRADALALLDLRRDGTRLALGHLTLAAGVRRREGLLASGLILAPAQPRAERTQVAVAALRSGSRSPAALRAATRGGDLVALAAARKLTARTGVPAPLRLAWPSVGLLNTLGVGHTGGWSRLPRAARRFRAFDTYQVIEQAPEPERRVTLAAERDAYGLRLPRLHWFVSERELASARRSQELFAAAFATAGLGRLVTSTQLAPDGDPRSVLHPSAHHHIGTTRMAPDAARGAVDADGRLHAAANVFATGTSVFPTGGFVNPTLTAIALAERLGDHLAAALQALPEGGPAS
jgi:choline dehydrogenase-like flavoprotein